MAWNPSPEVAVARDAAKRLDDADQVIVLYLNRRLDRIGMATYGKTKALCADAKTLGDAAYDAMYAVLKERAENEIA